MLSHTITLAFGDGNGPETMEAVLAIINEARAKLAIESIIMGQEQYKMNSKYGLPPTIWESLRRSKVLFHAPVSDPPSIDYNKPIEQMVKTLGLFARVRCFTAYPLLDYVLIDALDLPLYSNDTVLPDIAESEQMHSMSRFERTLRYSFEYGIRYNRKKVTLVADNAAMTAEKSLFYTIGEDYPSLIKEDCLLEDGGNLAAQDVIITHGDNSDLVANSVSSVSHIGDSFAVFTANQDFLPEPQRQDASSLLLAAIQMLIHIGQADVARRINEAWKATLKSGLVLDTHEFTKAVIANLK